jgi:tetratricopeptide (TPR) repeat protein
LAWLGRLPDGDPLTLTALGDRADLLFGDLQDPREAARTCERILRLDPANGEAHRRLCFFYAATLQREKLAAQARRAIDLGCETPETYVYVVGSDWLTLSNTLSVNSHWLKASPEDELFLVAAARGFVSNSGLEEEVAGEEEAEGAERVVPEHDRRLRELLDRFPGNLELLAYFLQKATTRGDVDEVTTLLGQAPPEAEADNRFWRFKGWVHGQSDQPAEAEAAYRRALEIDAYDFATQHQLGGALRKGGKLEEAADFARLAAEGRTLRKSILEQPDVRAIPPGVLREMGRYAEGCGDRDVAGKITARLRQIGTPPSAGGGPRSKVQIP